MRFKAQAKQRLAPHPRLFNVTRGLWRRARRLRAGNAQAHWDHWVDQVESGSYKGWLDYQFIEDEYIRPQISGDKRVYYLQHFFERWVGELPAERGLSLGCGGGNLERGLIAMNAARVIDGHDASAASIVLARRLAEEAGFGDRLHYHESNVDRIELPLATYDWVICKMSLHHFAELEHVCAQISGALKPGGVLMFNEFVGPTHHQWTDLQLELMNRMLETLPGSVRAVIPIHRFERLSVAEMKAIDPSESVRSAEILSVAAEYFEILEHRPYGGTLLQIFLQHVMPHLELENEWHCALLRSWFLYERTLVEHGVLPSDFAYVVARPRR
jgi:2-polyprenyl-3-methyl-5-hydroxy-6-metoxy-1,4-benzoquinol methylase